MTALIIVDIQNDFLPGGALAVPRGDEIIPIVNELMPRYELVVATQDWHPENHISFADNHPGKNAGETIDLDGIPQTLWPVHCVEGSEGAQFSEHLDTELINHIFKKGSDPKIDSYSGFFDNGHQADTGLSQFLKSKGVTEVHLVGLATDYCVKFTALDALTEGFKVTLIEDACRGVDLQEGDVEYALGDLKQKGANIVSSNQVLTVNEK